MQPDSLSNADRNILSTMFHDHSIECRSDIPFSDTLLSSRLILIPHFCNPLHYSPRSQLILNSTLCSPSTPEILSHNRYTLNRTVFFPFSSTFIRATVSLKKFFFYSIFPADVHHGVMAIHYCYHSCLPIRSKTILHALY